MILRRSLALLVVGVVMLAGCGGDGARNAPPTISGASVSPSTLRYVGGDVLISAAVEDAQGVEEVTADVTGPSGTTQVPLANVDGTYQAAFSAPVNGSTGAQAYTVTIHARDLRGAEAVPVGTSFTVQSAPTPPAQPGL